jgi:CDP-diacylglycerol--glycerol-3-phosphate 3-phosphatidyltransferase
MVMHVNLPNFITLVRFLLLPILIALIWPTPPLAMQAELAACLYGISSLLDILDGILARRMGQVTDWGKFFDPLVDKTVHLVLLIFLLDLPGFGVSPWVVALILCRELFVTFLRAVAATKGVVIAAETGGKIKTFLAATGMFALLWHYPVRSCLGDACFVLDMHSLGRGLTMLSLGFSLYSGWHYLKHYLSGLSSTD